MRPVVFGQWKAATKSGRKDQQEVGGVEGRKLSLAFLPTLSYLVALSYRHMGGKGFSFFSWLSLHCSYMGSLNPSHTLVKSPFITLWEVMVVMVMVLVEVAVVMDVVMSRLFIECHGCLLGCS